jgi:NAD(P)-dependent dehydrogenase (short-subunit alcohol dehydrogenase family)
MRFQNKVAIVTGGASGIGKEVATRFVAEGGSAVINGRNAKKTEAAAHEIDPSGKRVVAHVGDVALPTTGEALVRGVGDGFDCRSLDWVASRSGRETPLAPTA